MAEQSGRNLRLNNGTLMPIVGLGLSPGSSQKPLPQEEVTAIIEAVKSAIDVGYRHIDTAALYDTEEALGRAIREKTSDGTVKREDLYITTKLWNTNHRPERVEPALRQSLQKLNLDYIDLYLIHWPTAFQPYEGDVPRNSSGKVLFDNEVDLVDTWKAMEACQKKGLVKSIGVSNFTCKQLQRIFDNCEIRPANYQVESHPFNSNVKIVDFCLSNNVAVSCFSPVGGAPIYKGSLSSDEWVNVTGNETLAAIGKKYNKSAAQVFDFALTEDEMKTIFRMNDNVRLTRKITDEWCIGSKDNPLDENN